MAEARRHLCSGAAQKTDPVTRLEPDLGPRICSVLSTLRQYRFLQPLYGRHAGLWDWQLMAGQRP